MKLVSSSTEGVETKNSPESSLTVESEGLVVIGPGIRGRTDSQGLSSRGNNRSGSSFIPFLEIKGRPTPQTGNKYFHLGIDWGAFPTIREPWMDFRKGIVFWSFFFLSFNLNSLMRELVVACVRIVFSFGNGKCLTMGDRKEIEKS